MIIRNLDEILSNEITTNKFLLYWCGFHRDYEQQSFRNKEKDFIIGKIISDLRPEIIHYLNYLLMTDTIISIKCQEEIHIIHNINCILNSRYKTRFIEFLCGFFENKSPEDLVMAERIGNEFIMGLLLLMKEDKIFTFCEYLLSLLNEENSADMNDANPVNIQTDNN